MFDSLINDFGVYRENPNLTYLDYAATTFMPDCVVNAWVDYNVKVGDSINRGSGVLADKAQQYYQDSKKRILKFFDADNYDLIYGKNATECLNVIVNGLSGKLMRGDIILMSPYEHHSNLIPWRHIAKMCGAIIVQLPLLQDGSIDYLFAQKLDIERIKIITMTLVSNVNSNVLDLEKLDAIIRESNAYTIIDASQAVGHKKLSCKKIGADVYIMSAHKMYGPKGIGAAIIKKELIDELSPFLLGGGMVWNSMGKEIAWQPGVRKFEAGTIDVAGLVAWATACSYLNDLGMNTIQRIESDLGQYVLSKIEKDERINLIPHTSQNINMISFSVEGLHPHDLAEKMKNNQIEMRFGHLCAQNTIQMFGLTSVCRASWGIGCTRNDIDRFLTVLSESCL